MHRILITGCSSGLGLFLADKFENENHYVFRHMGKKHFDLNNKEDILNLSEVAKIEKINVLINNAAIVCPNVKFEEYDPILISSMINVNLLAPILLSYYLQNYLTDIININSIVGLEFKKLRPLYSATKWGLKGFSESLKLEKNNINILDVYPSNIKTKIDRLNALEIDFVVNEIYNSFVKKESKLVLDGRKI